MKFSKIKTILENANLKNLSIKVKKTGEIYKYGQNPYYDMEIENYILCPAGKEINWHGFCKNFYELLSEQNNLV